MFTKDNYNQKYFLSFLALATLVYFAAARIFQDWLYRGNKRPENLFESLGPLFAIAEPWEIPLYLLGFLVIPVLAIIFYKLYQKKIFKYFIFLVIGVGGLVVLKIILTKLGGLNFGVYIDYIANQGLGKTFWLLTTKRIYVARLIFLAAATAFLITYYKNFSLSKIHEWSKKPIWGKIEPFFVVLIILLIFHPNFPTQDHHYNYYIGPLNDILSGKPLLYETTHLYGLLNIYFLLPIFKFFLPLTYVSLSVVLFFFYSAFFLGLYYFLKNWLGSRFYGYLGLLVIVAIFYFFNSSPTRSLYLFPANSPLRFGLYLPVLGLILAYSKRPKTIFREFSVAISSLALFWNFDSGMFLAAATFITLAYIDSFSFKKVSLLAGKFISYIVAIIGVGSVLNYLVYSAWPNWSLFFKEIIPFGDGIGMFPLPLVGIFEIFVFIYLMVGLWIVREYRKGQIIDPVLVFLVSYGAFASLYYIGQSNWQNLTHISVPPILLVFYLFKKFPESRFTRSAFVALLTFAFLFMVVKVPVEFSNRDYKSFRALTDVPAVNEELYQDALYLKNNFLELERLPVIHLDDTELMTYIGQANYFDFYYLFTLYYAEEVEAIAQQVQDELPPYIFIGKERDDRMDLFIATGLEGYHKTESLRTLDVYEEGELGSGFTDNQS